MAARETARAREALRAWPDLGAASVPLDAYYALAQLQGRGRAASCATRERGWDVRVAEAAVDDAEFARRRDAGELHSARVLGARAAGMAEVELGPEHADGILRFGDVVVLQSVGTRRCAALAPTARAARAHLVATGAEGIAACARTALRVLRAPAPRAGLTPDPHGRVRCGERALLYVAGPVPDAWAAGDARAAARGADDGGEGDARLLVASHGNSLDYALALRSHGLAASTAQLDVIAAVGMSANEICW